MLFNQVGRTIDRYHLLEKGDRLIVGVSAGVDSMVLLYLLNAYRQALTLSLIVAHINHGFRPEESEKEAALVEKESKRLGLPFEYGQFDVKEFQKFSGLSPQDAARRIRFQFFQDLTEKHQANKIALGHHADDQIETILLRLIRGSGLQGLKGILPIRDGKVIRPLLEVWRAEIESFAIEKGIRFLLDSSNLKQDYLRNKIRLALIPSIEREIQSRFKQVLLRTSDILRVENDYLEKGSEEAYQKIVREKQNGIYFRFSEYQSLHPAIQWRVTRKMMEAIQNQGVTGKEIAWSAAHQIHQKLRTPPPSFILQLSCGVWIQKQYDMVELRKGFLTPVLPFEAELIFPGHTFIEEIGKKVLIEEVNRDQMEEGMDSSDIAFMDFENLRFPLKVRNFRPGDRFRPMGAKGTQKVKEFFIDHKVPKDERSKIPLLVSGEIIAWVIGYRIDDRVMITEKTKKILRIKVI